MAMPSVGRNRSTTSTEVTCSTGKSSLTAWATTPVPPPTSSTRRSSGDQSSRRLESMTALVDRLAVAVHRDVAGQERRHVVRRDRTLGSGWPAHERPAGREDVPAGQGERGDGRGNHDGEPHQVDQEVQRQDLQRVVGGQGHDIQGEGGEPAPYPEREPRMQAVPDRDDHHEGDQARDDIVDPKPVKADEDGAVEDGARRPDRQVAAGGANPRQRPSASGRERVT